MFGVILMSLLVMVAQALVNEDPLCIAKRCPSTTTCRVVLVGTTLEAQCLETPPQFSHTGVCLTGEPILMMGGSGLEDTKCGPTLPCPAEAYCNTDLMDTYATCCRSNLDAPVKSGTCPANTITDDTFCLDTCNNDGDCRHTDKCCQNGCNRDCIMAEPPTIIPLDPCSDKVCPDLTYCLKPDQEPCIGNICYQPGECVRCPGLCRMFCMFGNQKDSNGCPICRCNPAPINPSQNDATNNVIPGWGRRFPFLGGGQTDGTNNAYSRRLTDRQMFNLMLMYYLS